MLDWLAGLPPAVMMQTSWQVFAVVNAVHILGLGLLLGAILPLDLRLIGLLPGPPLAALVPFLTRVAAVGAGLAVVTGGLMFLAQPRNYLANPAFLVKLAALAVGFANVAIVHRLPAWRRVALAGAAPPPVLRLTAGVSLLAWLTALLAGRLIGFL